jgi:hypothetical protein
MPEFILFRLPLLSEETILGHESRDDYVTVDNMEFSEDTLISSAPTV